MFFWFLKVLLDILIVLLGHQILILNIYLITFLLMIHSHRHLFDYMCCTLL